MVHLNAETLVRCVVGDATTIEKESVKAHVEHCDLCSEVLRVLRKEDEEIGLMLGDWWETRSKGGNNGDN